MALGGLGVSLAGFAGLISALDRRPEGHTTITRWRIRNIVVGGFAATFIGFGIIAAYTVTRDEALTARVASLVITAFVIVRGYSEDRPGPAWPDERQRRYAIAGDGAFALVALGNVIVGSVGYLAFLMLGLLVAPVTSFVFAVRDIDLGRGAGGGGQESRNEPRD